MTYRKKSILGGGQNDTLSQGNKKVKGFTEIGTGLLTDHSQKDAASMPTKSGSKRKRSVSSKKKKSKRSKSKKSRSKSKKRMMRSSYMVGSIHSDIEDEEKPTEVLLAETMDILKQDQERKNRKFDKDHYERVGGCRVNYRELIEETAQK